MPKMICVHNFSTNKSFATLNILLFKCHLKVTMASIKAVSYGSYSWEAGLIIANRLSSQSQKVHFYMGICKSLLKKFQS